MQPTKVDLVQGSPEWIAHRKNYFNASEAGAVMECSPFEPRNHAELFDRKMGLTEFGGNFATRRGHELEPKAREALNTVHGDYQPQSFVNGRLAASLDGLCDDNGMILEIKCPVSADSPLFGIHSVESLKQIAPHYWWQIVHQHVVAESSGAWFMVYHPDGWQATFIDWESLADDVLELREAWGRFALFYDNNERPDDGIVFMGDGGYQAVSLAYRELLQKKREIDFELKTLEAKIKDLAESSGGQKVIGGGLLITRTERKGSVDYSKVPSLDGVDLDQYRKPPTTYWTIRESKQ